MDIRTIKEKAKEILEQKEEERLVSKYLDLLELRKSLKKQLKNVEKLIKKFEKDPEEYADKSDDRW